MSTAKEQPLRPWCPFCGMSVGRPNYAQERNMREFPGVVTSVSVGIAFLFAEVDSLSAFQF